MMIATLRCGDAIAEIAVQGAEAQSWSVGGQSLLWHADPAFWADTAPVLFPVVGWTNGGKVRIGETHFPLGLHGFARHSEFAIARRSATSLRLDLAANPATRALYPFDFRLGVEYDLTETAFTTALIVANCGSGPMPYACGLHPGFRWPFSGETAADYRLVFETAEQSEVPEISDKGLFLPTRRSVPIAGAVLPLETELFAKEALCFLHARSRRLRFEHRSGAAIIVEADDFPHFALWSRPGAPFLAIETWTGYGDPQDFAGDLFEKPGMRVLEPGAVARHAATYLFAAAPVRC